MSLLTRRHRLTRSAACAAVTVVGLLASLGLTSCADSGHAPDEGTRPVLAQAGQQTARVNDRHVIAISVDGLNPRALSKLGRKRTPNLHALVFDEGAGTVNARTQTEMTVTLPNHTSMVTGRRIAADKGGHGVTWNSESDHRSVHQAAGEDVGSVFRQVHAAGGRTGVYATKAKFALFKRSWPGAVDRNVIKVENNTAAVRALRSDLASRPPSFAFLHLGKPDQAGHRSGWLGKRYLKAVRTVDRLLGSVMRQVRSTPALRGSTVIVLTSDHGGPKGDKNHSDRRDIQNYRVPFAIWGAGVDNVGLYRLNPQRATPGRGRPGPGAARQPIRNGDLGNVSLSLLGLPPIPGSKWGRGQDLTWRR
ncbi:alkaline phosphatase family protein [Nocardioides sp. zg-536]|uniref:Alkaline phosphatase family protein n=1 Tax=Nocardioides faecalis TaxID=2803858 RepID=A0A939BTM1_9ACTN|nr:alkaline phosphatase family protein [Nocardioides faecalis]MBM9460794.1 alkaline phosphatase family protein [Nocardioides faecalis]QVI57985.1 alkaline phosphatase family protein [Nocardioides faecalis]